MGHTFIVIGWSETNQGPGSTLYHKILLVLTKYPVSIPMPAGSE